MADKKGTNMNIDNLTIGELKSLQALLGGAVQQSRRLPMPVGTKVFIRTVTHHYTGRVTAVAEDEVELSEAAWIADDGRFHDAMTKGILSEVEPYADGQRVVVNRTAIIDWAEWQHDMPRSQK